MRVEVELTVRNGYVREALKARGWSQAELARQAGVEQNVVSRIVRMRMHALRSKDDAILRVAVALGLSIDQVAPPELADRDFGGKVSAIGETDLAALEAKMGQATLLLGTHEEDPMLEAQDRAELLREALEACVPERYRQVLEMRYGLNGHREHTRAEIGKKLGRSVARIQQMEAKALRHAEEGLTRRTNERMRSGYREVEDLSA